MLHLNLYFVSQANVFNSRSRKDKTVLFCFFRKKPLRNTRKNITRTEIEKKTYTRAECTDR